jgi:hypothetical protein
MLMRQQVAIALITPSQDHLLAMNIEERLLVQPENTLALLSNLQASRKSV